ncbi:MAG: exosortase T [Paracoccaceae bacterium]
MTRAPIDTAALVFALASALLAAAPLAWLVRSWSEPAYASDGWAHAGLLGLLVALGLASGRPRHDAPRPPVLALLIGAALVRLAGQVLAINLLSALALALDVLALARLARLDARPVALSPLWLAGLFLFALPLHGVVERAIGFPLQLVSAAGACGLLAPLYDDLACAGTRITVDGLDVLVDLPCSGASGLVTMLALATAANAVLRPRLLTGCLALGAALGLALGANVLRIALLAAGLVEREALGLDVMAEPWHAGIGLAALALGARPLALFYRPRPAPPSVRGASGRRLPAPLRLAGGGLALAAALAIVSAEGRPLATSGAVAAPALPGQIAGRRAEPVALAPIEAVYFTRYGGRAAKARYGALGLNVVATRSALRHLHGPETCLRGLGYEVRPLGTRVEDGVPSAVFRAEAPDGRVWRVDVTYVSEHGRTASSVAEAVWHWFRAPGTAWTAVQRLTPADLPDAERRALDRAALAALDVGAGRAASDPGAGPASPLAAR